LPETLSVKTDHVTLISYKTDSTFKYMHGGDKLSCLADIATTVHELNHLLAREYPFEYCHLNNRSFFENSMYYFYIGRGDELPIFSNVDFFPSRDLVSQIPLECHTFRYNPYIEGNLSTQDDGLLGLLDEYNSYCHTMAATWELKEAYMKAGIIDVKGYTKWMGTLNTWVQAYYEFRYFILEYLRYARFSNYDVYGQIKDEPDLITVFNHITQRYNIYIAQFEKEVAYGAQNYWQKKGYKAYLNEKRKFFFIGKDGWATGFQVQMNDKDKLLPLLQSDRYDEIISELNIVP
jgi:hypothetical protein